MADGLLKWANRHTRGHDHITPVNDYEESWADGLAFCALFYAYFPEKIPIKSLKADTDADKIKNLTLAFKVATEAGIEPLLDPEDTLRVHEKKSITLYISEIYSVLKELPVKFSASAEWNKKFEAEEKARKFAEWKAKKEAEAKGEIYTPQKAARTGSVASKWNPEGVKDEEEPTPSATSTPAAAAAAATPSTRTTVSSRWNPKGPEEKEPAKPAAEPSKPAAVSTSSGAAAGGEGLTYEISGRSKDGGTEGSMMIFTVTLKLDGKPLSNPKKEDLAVHVDCPGTVPRFNIMGGSGGAYHIGLTPTFGGQYWFDFVWRGIWCNEPFCLPIKNKFNKLVDHPYTGAERAAAGQKVGSASAPAPAPAPAPAASAQSAATRVTSGTPAKPKAKEPSAEHSLCSDRVAEMADDDLGSFTITAKDDTDQLLKGDFTFDVKITGPSHVDTKLTNNHDGTYTCSFGPISTAGNYIILVTTGGKEIKKGKWDLKVNEAMADLEFEDVTILFQATDKDGVPKSLGGDIFEIVASGDEQPEIIDLEDGRYTLDYHVIPGVNSINVLFNGESLSGFPVTFEV